MVFAQKFFAEFPPTAVLRGTGDDVAGFLQGQFTNELRLAAGSTAYGLWLNQKGKVLADSQILRISEKEFLIVSSRTPAAAIRQRLEDYIIADDVTLADETGSMAGLCIGGAEDAAALAQSLGGIPPAGKFTQAQGLLVWPGSALPGPHFMILGPHAPVADLRRQLQAQGWVERSADQLEAARIRAGIPAVPADIGPGDLPNEGGLDETAVSYTKGCYLGQEVMARLKNLGQVRRRLHVVEGAGPVPAPLTPLYQGGKKVGETRSVAAEDGGFVAFAMLSLVNLQPDAGLSLAPDGPVAARINPHG